MIIDVLRGAHTDRISQFRLDDTLNYGALQSLSREQVSALLDRLQEIRALRIEVLETRTGQYPVLQLGDQAEDILDGNVQVSILARPQKKEKKKSDDLPANVDRDLFARLKELRKKIAFSRGIPPYIIFQDNVLRNLADKKPTSMEEMEKISGIGVVKLREFGKTFLKEIQKYLAESQTPSEEVDK